MLFERLFPFRFENSGDDSLLIRVDDDDFIVPAGACLSSQDRAIYLTSPGDAAMRAFPVRADLRRREPTRPVRQNHTPSGLTAKILARVTANLI